MGKKNKKITQKEAYKKGTDYQFDTESILLGPWTSFSLLNDPKHLCFVLSRYKFCAKMFEEKDSILEIGCGDGFGIPLVAQDKKYVLGIDVDNRLIEDNKKRLEKIKNIKFRKMDICKEIPKEKFDGVFSIDVIEHLDQRLEEYFMKNSCACLKKKGIYIIGTPNIAAKKYATPRSTVQHINLKSYKTLKGLMKKYFENVIVFSMNDEVVHTGFKSMAHYLFGIGIGLKEGRVKEI